MLLTSHYMADVEALCKRVVVIHHGSAALRWRADGAGAALRPHKVIAVEVAGDGIDLARYGEVVASSGGRVTLRVPKERDRAGDRTAPLGAHR